MAGKETRVSSLPPGGEWDGGGGLLPSPLHLRAAAWPILLPTPHPPLLPQGLELEGDELGRWRDRVSGEIIVINRIFLPGMGSKKIYHPGQLAPGQQTMAVNVRSRQRGRLAFLTSAPLGHQHPLTNSERTHLTSYSAREQAYTRFVCGVTTVAKPQGWELEAEELGEEVGEVKGEVLAWVVSSQPTEGPQSQGANPRSQLKTVAQANGTAPHLAARPTEGGGGLRCRRLAPGRAPQRPQQLEREGRDR